MTATSHPKAGTTIEAGEMAEHLKKILSMADRVEETFVLATSPVSLNATLTPGKAFIQGYEVGESGDAAENITFTSASTNHVFIDQAGVVTVNTSGTPPANSIKLYEVVTDGSGVTSETNVEASEVEFLASVVTQALTVLGDFAAESGVLSDAQPYLEFEDTSGETFRIWSRSNKLQITNFDGSTVYTDDLSDVFGGASFIDSSEKGAANGVAELDGGGTVPSAQLPAATEGAKGAVELADAAPPGLAAASAKGASTEAAREDHTHSHGDRSAEGGTQHNLNQSSGTISDAQHGNRGGGALHANATGGAAGFLSASDKSKLDALSSDDDYMFTAGSLETSDLDDQTRAGAFGWTNTAINSPVSSSYGIGLNVVSDGPEYNGSSNWIVQYGNPTGAQGIYWRQAINASPWTAWKRLSQDADSAGGDLTGTYPNPTIGTSKVTNAKMADNAIGTAELINDAVTNSKLANMADDTVKARNGGAGDPEDIAIAADRVLGRDGSGDLGSVQVTDAAIKSGVSATPVANNIPKYDAGGRLESNDPGSAKEVVNKQYLEANSTFGTATAVQYPTMAGPSDPNFDQFPFGVIPTNTTTGRAMAAYGDTLYCIGFDTVTNRPIFTKSTNGGSTWGSATDIFTSGYASSSDFQTVRPVVISASIVNLIYQHSGSDEIRCIRTTNGGTSWSESVIHNATDVIQASYDIQVCDDGTIWLGFVANSSGASYPWAAKSTDDGATWNDYQADTTQYFNPVSIAGVDANTAAVFHGSASTTKCSITTNGGTSWTTSTVLNGSSMTVRAASGVSSTGRIVVFFAYSTSNYAGISDDNGASWDTIVLLPHRTTPPGINSTIHKMTNGDIYDADATTLNSGSKMFELISVDKLTFSFLGSTGVEAGQLELFFDWSSSQSNPQFYYFKAVISGATKIRPMYSKTQVAAIGRP